ncbi:vesicle-associated membrane protein 5-like [Denticeps clupeoides]|uniref:vesicle-associated membrane protein 5-like n=1 Tax=Denticeps clupeoides TaxID=299321 RepID=UPI0010A34599|nr:vesicle-associated membrane protein 5-like [Denticeps clupeoides]
MASKLQQEVEEVKVVMIENMNKSEERSEKLTDLEERSDNLRNSGKMFVKTSQKVKDEKKKQNVRSKYILYAIVGSLALIIIIVLVISLTYNKTTSVQNTSTSSPP